MINIWEFEYCGMVEITDIENNVFVGDAQEITDESERFDDERREDGITILFEGQLIEFYVSDIKSIKKINM